MSRPTTRLADIAAMAGVSISTASRALNDSPSINDRTKRLIWKLAREHDYPFRRSMPAGPIGATGTIALVVPRPQGREGLLSDPFFLELFAGIGDAARERGCDVLVSHFVPTSYDDLSAAMTTSRANGLIFFGQSSLHHALNRLSKTEGRFVVWGALLPDQRYCSIGSDNLMGGRRATLHLTRLGRKRIVFLGASDAPEITQRVRGYHEALKQAGLTADAELIVPSHFTMESAEAVVDGLLAQDIGFDAIFAASDVIALGAMRALQRAGVEIPKDVSVVGYDDVPFARYSSPALSTVSQNAENAARLLVSKLLDGSRGDIRSERVSTDLIVRESCGG